VGPVGRTVGGSTDHTDRATVDGRWCRCGRWNFQWES